MTRVPNPPPSALLNPRVYVRDTDPAKNEQLWKLLMKLDGYGVADQQRRLLLLTDQDNRVYALRYLAQHLDLLHLLDLVRSLTTHLWYKIADFGKNQGKFEWPWQWGEEPPPHEMVPLPHLTDMKWGDRPPQRTEAGKSAIELAFEDVWHNVRPVMLAHGRYIDDDQDEEVVYCSCSKQFDSVVLYEKHLRAKVKEAIVGSS